jgi:hypothetical protein
VRGCSGGAVPSPPVLQCAPFSSGLLGDKVGQRGADGPTIRGWVHISWYGGRVM